MKNKLILLALTINLAILMSYIGAGYITGILMAFFLFGDLLD